MPDHVQSAKFDIECPRCGSQNELVASDLNATIGVTCSHCGKPLGTVGEILKEDNEQAEPQGSPGATMQGNRAP